MSSTQTIYEEYHRSSTSTQTANCTTPLINKEIMTEASLTRLIDMGDEIQWYRKWMDFVDGEDGFFYGIPCDARRVVKFNPLDKSLTEIGPDLGEGTWKWMCGVRAYTGNIYCAPYHADHVLKINTNDGTVETLDNVELPETGDFLPETGSGLRGLWQSGALAPDNNIYYMPSYARRIMRLNPDNDTLSSVGDDLGRGEYCKYSGTVVGNDDLVYGIPRHATRIIKYNPADDPDTTCTVGEETEVWFMCGDKGALGGDGYIYAANWYGQVLQIDTTNGNYILIGDVISHVEGQGWGDPIVGVDKCIYWPPYNANRVLKFDPGTQRLPLLVGGVLGEDNGKWIGGALATDGVIYCIPPKAKQILGIDPFKELATTLHNNLRQHPQELGRLFAKKYDGRNETFYGSAVRKFGIEKVFKILVEECLPSDKEWADTRSGNLPLFMIAASCKNCAASVIYHLLRRNVHDALPGNDVGVSKKRKHGSV
jgi:hypothetical protein